ncbi:Tim44/TimA family putative adaptor protein [Albidovulum sp.]
MSNSLIQLLVLAGIAIFLIIKLKSVLGTRSGYEKPPAPAPVADRREPRFDVIEGGADHDIIDHVPQGSDAARALAQMKEVEPSFSVQRFLAGARSAYEMILMAFERGDLDPVRPFLAADVLDAFVEAVEARRARGLTVTAEFLGIRDIAIKDATFDPETGEAEIAVRFVGELISSARDAEGRIVEGNPNAVRKQRDVWTFARRMGGGDPNWQLVATGE